MNKDLEQSLKCLRYSLLFYSKETELHKNSYLKYQRENLKKNIYLTRNNHTLDNDDRE